MAHTGVYDFVVLADDKEVDRQQFMVVVPQEKNYETEDPKDPDDSE